MDTPEYPVSTPSSNGSAFTAPPPPVRPRRARGRVVAVAALTTGLCLGVGGGVVSHAFAAGQPVASASQWSASGGSGSAATGWTYPSGRGRFGGGSGAFAGGSAQPTTTLASSGQQVGVVDIDVVLGGTQRAAGTGMVLTSDGEVLTNRHVVEGESSISATVTATGRTYSARVIGISTTTDVAVVQLVDASGLATVKTSSNAVQAGDPVVAVGNAGGTGGTPSAAAGSVTGTDQAITASDNDGSNPEQLTGLIETDAGIQPGDSGGPLLNASDEVVGMDTAASAQGNDGYAIPVSAALEVAHQIEAGGAGTQAGAGSSASSAQRAYLGVQVQDSADGPDGAQVAGVVQGSPAAAAGLTAGDTITSVAGHRVSSAEDLVAVMTSLSPGQSQVVTWVDQDGTAHTAGITPTAGQ